MFPSDGRPVPRHYLQNRGIHFLRFRRMKMSSP